MREAFPDEGNQLQRYAARFSAVEINTSFYRPHQPQTYERWAAAVPAAFRFAVKLPQHITHELALRAVARPLDRFLDEAGALGRKLGALLVQLPPSLVFDRRVAPRFFAQLRARYAGVIAVEPRHVSWFATGAMTVFEDLQLVRVAADPPRAADGDRGGWTGAVYYRLHGAPRVYYSSYDEHQLAALAQALRAHRRRGATTWCIFDNTASGAAAANALQLSQLLARR